jgi:hypothetical protein
MALVIELSVTSLIDESIARGLLEILEGLEGFQPERYDLNERGSWRAWSLQSAVVDLLTQRTLMFRIEGTGGTAVIATGKQGENPTMIIEGEATEQFDQDALRGLPVARFREV